MADMMAYVATRPEDPLTLEQVGCMIDVHVYIIYHTRTRISLVRTLLHCVKKSTLCRARSSIHTVSNALLTYSSNSVCDPRPKSSSHT